MSQDPYGLGACIAQDVRIIGSDCASDLNFKVLGHILIIFSCLQPLLFTSLHQGFFVQLQAEYSYP